MSEAREFPRPSVADFAQITALLTASGLPTSDLTLSALAHFRVAHDGEGVAAVGGLQPLGTVGLLRSVCVAPGHRGRGLARRLVATLEAEAARMGLTTLYLLTSSAEAFFARHGYAALPRESAPAAVRDTPEFSHLCPDTAVCMHKTLDKAA